MSEVELPAKIGADLPETSPEIQAMIDYAIKQYPNTDPFFIRLALIKSLEEEEKGNMEVEVSEDLDRRHGYHLKQGYGEGCTIKDDLSDIAEQQSE